MWTNIIVTDLLTHKSWPEAKLYTVALTQHLSYYSVVWSHSTDSGACQLGTPTRYLRCRLWCEQLTGTTKASWRLIMKIYGAGCTWGLEAAALFCSAGELSLRLPPSPFTAGVEPCLSAFLSFPRILFNFARRALTDMVPSLASKRKLNPLFHITFHY